MSIINIMKNKSCPSNIMLTSIEAAVEAKPCTLFFLLPACMPWLALSLLSVLKHPHPHPERQSLCPNPANPLVCSVCDSFPTETSYFLSGGQYGNQGPRHCSCRHAQCRLPQPLLSVSRSSMISYDLRSVKICSDLLRSIKSISIQGLALTFLAFLTYLDSQRWSNVGKVGTRLETFGLLELPMHCSNRCNKQYPIAIPNSIQWIQYLFTSHASNAQYLFLYRLYYTVWLQF